MVLTPTSVVWNAVNSYWEVTLTTSILGQFRFHAVNPLGSALPVTLGELIGRKVNKTNVLNWNTITENNCKTFEAEVVIVEPIVVQSDKFPVSKLST